MMGALAVHHTATENSAWDGPAAVAAMPNDAATLAYCHAWRDGSAASDAKSDYKFPHHRTKGGPANLAACRNGLARLDGSTIPDGDKAGVKSHLQAHLDDAKEKNAVTRDVSSYGWMSSTERLRNFAPRVQRLSEKSTWFRIMDSTDGVAPARMEVYGEIGFWGMVSASDFSAQLNAVSAPAIDVHINSPGGDVFDGIAILNLLRGHPASINVVVDGLAASAASFIAMAGDTVTMMPNSQLMVHDASGICAGNHADMMAMADLLDKCSDNIASVYARRAGGATDTWRATMRAETWYSADEAVSAGLADSVHELDDQQNTGLAALKSAAQAISVDSWNLSMYRYANRASAPPPAQLDPPTMDFDPELFRAAIRDAVSITDRKVAG